MDITVNCALAEALGAELRAQRDELTRRWLERIAARVALHPNRIFPTDELLDHVPLLIDGIAGYLEDPADEITADMPVIAKALELGELRHDQGFDASEILKEYELLGGVLFSYLMRCVDRLPEPCSRAELLALGHRLFRAISVVQQVTTTQYLNLAHERVREREERLRGFNRTVSHELKNRIGAAAGAAEMLGEEWIRADPEQLRRFSRIVLANTEAMKAILQDLLALSHTDTDTRQQRHILLPEAVAEVTRQLRELARDQGVAIRVAPNLPEVEINASAVELCLSNYVSNAIKYSDPHAPDRWVEITGGVRDAPDGAELWVAVRDNGIGVAPEARERLFQRFFRTDAATERGIEGTGLGLSIVQETMESLGGRAWADFDGGPGSTFGFMLPLRRRVDTG